MLDSRSFERGSKMPTPKFLADRRRHLEARLAFARARLLGELPEAHRRWKRTVAIPELEAALERIARGSYGICDSCGEPIPEARLRLRPEALRCQPCQTLEEAHAA